MERYLVDYRIQYGHSVQACSSAGGMGEKNELVS